MSRDKESYEAKRWLETGSEDLDNDRFSHACFFAHQVGEKALKALWDFIGEDPWGHSIQKLILEFPDCQG
jgi:HEPN domain-containing protein